MRLRSLLALVVLGIVAAFLAANWRIFSSSANFSLGYTVFDAPIGAVMLVLFALVLGVLASVIGVWHGALLLEFRRQARQLEAQRTLADDAEASRITELNALLRTEMAKSNQRVDDAIAGLRADLTAMENSISATLGEMDDRYGRRDLAP